MHLCMKTIYLLFQHLHNLIIVFRLMGKRTVRTVLYFSSVFFKIFGIARTIFPQIHWAVTKQTVKIRQSLVTGKISALPVFKKTIWIFHSIWPLPLLLWIERTGARFFIPHCFFYQRLCESRIWGIIQMRKSHPMCLIYYHTGIISPCHRF